MAKVGLYLFLVAVLIEGSSQTLEEDINEEINNPNGTERSLSRRRRYLVFPSGSSLQLVYCLTVPSVGMGQIFTLGHTAALAWELPDKPEFLLDLKDKKFPGATEAPETTTMPPLHLDHDYDHNFGHDYDSLHHQNDEPSPLERFDKPSQYPSGRWSLQYSKRPGAVNNRKTYYDPFFINKQLSSLFDHTPVKAMSNPVAFGGLQKNSITGLGARGKATFQPRNRPKPFKSTNKDNRRTNQQKPVTTYIHPVYHQHYRRTRRDLYGKIEKLFTALSKDGKSCILKAICEVSQVAQRKGTFIEEIIKAIFRVKPHDDYPDEDHYDTAANKSHNCTEQYPTCDGSIWRSMLGY